MPIWLIYHLIWVKYIFDVAYSVKKYEYLHKIEKTTKPVITQNGGDNSVGNYSIVLRLATIINSTLANIMHSLKVSRCW